MHCWTMNNNYMTGRLFSGPIYGLLMIVFVSVTAGDAVADRLASQYRVCHKNSRTKMDFSLAHNKLRMVIISNIKRNRSKTGIAVAKVSLYTNGSRRLIVLYHRSFLIR